MSMMIRRHKKPDEAKKATTFSAESEASLEETSEEKPEHSAGEDETEKEEVPKKRGRPPRK